MDPWRIFLISFAVGAVRVLIELYKDWKAKRIIRLVEGRDGTFRPSRRLDRLETAIKLFFWWHIPAIFIGFGIAFVIEFYL